LVNRLLRRDRARDLSHLSRKSLRLHRTRDDERHTARAGERLRGREVELRKQILIQPDLANGSHNANNRRRWSAISVESLPDRVFSREISAYQLVVHDHDRFGRARIALGEFSTADDANTERSKILAAHHSNLGVRATTDFGLVGPSDDVKESICRPALHRQHARHAGGTNPRHRAKTIEHRSIELRVPQCVRHPCGRGREVEGQYAVGAKACVDIEERRKAANHQPGAREQNDRQRNLGGDQGL
jgi:hypothetical protein